MQLHANKFPHSMMWITAIAIILFCAAGIAAIMGWIPTSIGHTGAPQASAVKPADTAQQLHNAPRPGTNGHPARGKCMECGTVEAVREIEQKGQGTGLGAVGGAVVGGLIGNQVGSGHGKDLATAIGIVGGGVAGNEVEKRAKSTKSYEVIVRMNDGSTRVIHEAYPPGWRAGDRVIIVDGALRPE